MRAGLHFSRRPSPAALFCVAQECPEKVGGGERLEDEVEMEGIGGGVNQGDWGGANAGAAISLWRLGFSPVAAPFIPRSQSNWMDEIHRVSYWQDPMVQKC
jgi:hypothetical protein